MESEKAVTQMASTMKRPLVFTNGAFRVFHAGHLRCLTEAQSLGESIVVAVNSDASLAALGRPAVQAASLRMAVVSRILLGEMKFPPQRIWLLAFDEPTPLKLIEALRPDVLVKGGEYVGQDIPGAEFVKSYGGRVHFTEHIEGLSATRLLAESAHEKSPQR